MHCRAGLYFPELRTALRFLFHEGEWNFPCCGKGCVLRIRHGCLCISDLLSQTDVIHMQLSEEIPLLFGWQPLFFEKRVKSTSLNSQKVQDQAVPVSRPVTLQHCCCCWTIKTACSQPTDNLMVKFKKVVSTVHKHQHISAVNQSGNPVFKAL